MLKIQKDLMDTGSSAWGSDLKQNHNNSQGYSQKETEIITQVFSSDGANSCSALQAPEICSSSDAFVAP